MDLCGFLSAGPGQEAPELLAPGSPEAKDENEGDMNCCETVMNLANTMMGSGVLAIPFAFALLSYWAVPLLLFVVAVTAFTACLIGEKLMISRSQRVSGAVAQCAGRDFTFLAEVSYGQWGKGVVAVITALEVWVAAVTFLVMNGSNLQGILGISEVEAVLLCTLVSTLMIFIPLRLYAYVSLASLCALLIASLSYLSELGSAEKHLPALRWEPSLGNIFRAYGLFIFCFAGHPCLPPLHEGMQYTRQWSCCVAWSFGLACCYYLLLGLASFVVNGEEVQQVFTKDMQISWLRHLAAGFFAVKIQLTTPVLLRVVLQSMQIWPKSGQVQELIWSSLPVAVVILLTGSCACFLAGEVAALASFVGALLVNLTSIVIPCVMYMRLSMWSPQKDKVKLILCALLVVFGFTTAVGGTYLAVVDMSHPGS